MAGGLLFGRERPGGDYEALHIVQDRTSGLRAVIVVHDTTLGPGAGGIRRRAYKDDAGLLADGLALAEAMTYKCAIAELPAGGAKAVVWDHDGLDQPGAYRALGRAIQALDGGYLCGPDVGTGEDQLAHVREVCDFVNPLGNDPNTATALGVVAGIQGLLDVLDGDGALAGKRFVVQGLGGVGLEVARRLHEAGGEVLGADLDEDRVAQAKGLGIDALDPVRVPETPCDVFVPCAVGGVLSEPVARTLPARGICGSANNQLASPSAGEILHERDVLYAPDLVVNAGAVIEGVLTNKRGATGEVRQAAREHILATRDRLASLLEASRKQDARPEVVAIQRARDRLDAAR